MLALPGRAALAASVTPAVTPAMTPAMTASVASTPATRSVLLPHLLELEGLLLAEDRAELRLGLLAERPHALARRGFVGPGGLPQRPALRCGVAEHARHLLRLRLVQLEALGHPGDPAGDPLLAMLGTELRRPRLLLGGEHLPHLLAELSPLGSERVEVTLLAERPRLPSVGLADGPHLLALGVAEVQLLGHAPHP